MPLVVRNFAEEIASVKADFNTTLEGNSGNNTSQAVFKQLRKLWKIIMDTEGAYLVDIYSIDLINQSGLPTISILKAVERNLRRASALAQHFEKNDYYYRDKTRELIRDVEYEEIVNSAGRQVEMFTGLTLEGLESARSHMH